MLVPLLFTFFTFVLEQMVTERARTQDLRTRGVALDATPLRCNHINRGVDDPSRPNISSSQQ